jgi:hypothetical protein
LEPCSHKPTIPILGGLRDLTQWDRTCHRKSNHMPRLLPKSMPCATSAGARHTWCRVLGTVDCGRCVNQETPRLASAAFADFSASRLLIQGHQAMDPRPVHLAGHQDPLGDLGLYPWCSFDRFLHTTSRGGGGNRFRFEISKTRSGDRIALNMFSLPDPSQTQCVFAGVCVYQKRMFLTVLFFCLRRSCNFLGRFLLLFRQCG